MPAAMPTPAAPPPPLPATILPTDIAELKATLRDHANAAHGEAWAAVSLMVLDAEGRVVELVSTRR